MFCKKVSDKMEHPLLILCVRFHINICRLFEKSLASLICAHYGVCSTECNVIYCNRS
jgi:hypothetical protein